MRVLLALLMALLSCLACSQVKLYTFEAKNCTHNFVADAARDRVYAFETDPDNGQNLSIVEVQLSTGASSKWSVSTPIRLNDSVTASCLEPLTGDLLFVGHNYSTGFWELIRIRPSTRLIIARRAIEPKQMLLTVSQNRLYSFNYTGEVVEYDLNSLAVLRVSAKSPWVYGGIYYGDGDSDYHRLYIDQARRRIIVSWVSLSQGSSSAYDLDTFETVAHARLSYGARAGMYDYTLGRIIRDESDEDYRIQLHLAYTLDSLLPVPITGFEGMRAGVQLASGKFVVLKHINSRWFLVTIDASGTTLSQLDVTGAAMGGYPPIPLDSNRFLILSNGETIQWTFSVYRFPDPTNIWTGARTVVVGRSVTLKANLKTQVGSVPLPNQPIEFYAGARLLGNATTNAAGDANLTIVPPADLAPGVYALRAVFPGTPGQQRAEATATLTITRESSSVWVGTRFGTIGQPAALRASLTNRTTNLPMAGESLRFSVGAVVLGDAVTGADGFADLNVVLPDTLNSGAQTLTVTYAGSASVSGSSGTATLTITKATPGLWVGNRAGTIGTSVTLDAILTRSGNPVVGRAVEFRVGGNLLASGVTDSTGRASVPTILPDWLTAGSLTLTASFAGDGAYNAISRTATLTVSKANTSMWVGSRSGKANAPVQYRAFLKSGTTYIVGRTLVIKVNGVQVGTAITDATGYITINTTIPNLAPGTYPLTANFAGDGAYNASSASGTLTVTP